MPPDMERKARRSRRTLVPRKTVDRRPFEQRLPGGDEPTSWAEDENVQAGHVLGDEPWKGARRGTDADDRGLREPNHGLDARFASNADVVDEPDTSLGRPASTPTRRRPHQREETHGSTWSFSDVGLR